MTDDTNTSEELVPRDKSRLLIVDDEDLVRRTFQRILASELPEHQIEAASDGAEGVEMFREGHHGVILLDLYLPIMNGLDTFRQIELECKARNWEMPCVVFWSGFYPPDTIKNIVDSNPAHYMLHKPVTAKVLMDALNERLA